ncbi:MAG TPA: hypothetical protein VLF40_00075 [Candidatus Saccharimonadales bacterium]|nr:hypothetical protein [Candidatus Saccharimonadales bacterium]
MPGKEVAVTQRGGETYNYNTVYVTHDDGDAIGYVDHGDIANEMLHQLDLPYPHAHNLDTFLLAHFVCNVGKADRAQSGNVAGCLAAAVEAVSGEDSGIFSAGPDQHENVWDLDAVGALLLPEGGVLTAQSKVLLDQKYGNQARYANVTSNQGTHVLTRDHMRKLREKRLGNIRTDLSIFSGVGRVVFFITPKEDAQLSWPYDHRGITLTTQYEMEDAGKLPFIPGAVLVGANRYGEYYFSPADKDPYATCRVPISGRHQRKLVRRYRELGLDSLATRVDSYSDLTVEALREAIEAESEYLMTDKYIGSIYNPEKMRLDDFKDFVIGGRAQLQCTGAHNFLRLSLEVAFGRGCCGSVSGHLFSGPASRITEEKHIQTTFAHKGYTYILDATPSSNEYLAPSARSRSDHNAGAQASFTPDYVDVGVHKLSSVQVEAISATTVEEVKEPTAAEKLGAVAVGLNKQLCVYFDVPNVDVLYERLHKLPEDDPIRRTLKEILRAADNGVVASLEILEEVKRYVDRYTQNDKATLDRYGLRQYDADLTRMLFAALGKTVYIGRQQQAAQADAD